MEQRIGISGWRYEPWRGVFYPPGLPQRRELEYASRKLNSIEINGSFYSLQTPQSYKSWYGETPEGFVFAVKGPRYITHIRRLKEFAAPLGNFFASGLFHLKEKLGPILWQLPPNFLYRPERIEAFFEQMPRTVGEAVKFSRRADRREPDFPAEAEKSPQKIRHALEVRHPSFENPDFPEQLRKLDVAIVFADTAGTWPYIEDLTSDFVYCRLHGEKEIYRSGYEDHSLRFWARRLKTWQAGREVRGQLSLAEPRPASVKRDLYVYFDNDVKVRAPFDAVRLAAMLTSSAPTHEAHHLALPQ